MAFREGQRKKGQKIEKKRPARNPSPLSAEL
jgi:hypothetical protein